MSHFLLLGLLLGAAALAACIDASTEADPVLLGAGFGSDAGAGSGSDCGSSVTRLDLSLDRTSITTELATQNPIVVTLTGSGGFGGTATLSGTVRDAGGNIIPGWAITFDTTSVTVPTNGTATATATVTIPSQNVGLAATAQITVTSSAVTGTFTRSASLTALNQITFGIGMLNGLCTYPAPGGTVYASIGTKLRWLNKPTNPSTIVIHVDTNPNGVFHQSTSPGSAPGGIYEVTLTGTPGLSFRWYCHSPGPVVSNYIQPVN
ncbi:MAG TPA: hypothetical protein VNO30_43445 [Kofleriaceae bacterium]|nr:hypothetical protein [Kofleriaceae bacterium]